MTSEVATRETTALTAAPSPMQQHSATAMRLVEWANEAHAAHQLAQSLCKTPFAGQFKGDPDAATAAILRGHEMGLTPVTSLAAFDLIQGQPAPKALTLRALAQSHGHDIEITEVSEDRAVARYRRAGRSEWQTCEFTWDDAQKLGLSNKDNWKRQRKTMLEARVTSKAARLVASDVILGIGYSSEELRDDPTPMTDARPGLAAALGMAKPEPEPVAPPESTEPADYDPTDEPGWGEDK